MSADIFQVSISLIAIVLLILLIAYIVSKLDFVKQQISNKKNTNLKIIDSLTIEPNRKILCIKNNDKEYVIFLGKHNEIMLDSNKKT